MRALAALVAVFALMVQALVPAAAMAAAPDASGVPGAWGLVICTQNGATTAAPRGDPSKPKGFAGMPCQDCLAAALAMTQTPELAVQPVAYVAARIEHAPAERPIEPRARAPPRPPGQGPPTA
ncbi:MAG: hypothetical protein JWQ29_2011 [Phenylobacterium sp.]|nr:hypothetical protein [Phenylobacterium sp.]